MKSKRISVTITEEMVESYEMIFGKQNQLPPTFPMLFYKYIEIPWEYEAEAIHRKQKCVCYSQLMVGESYECEVLLESKVKRGMNTFYTQTLVGFDLAGKESFRCVSKLVVRSS